MQLYRFEHMGKVCAGDYLYQDKFNQGDDSDYLVIKGQFIYVMILIIYGMIGFVVFSVVIIALTLKYQNVNIRKSVQILTAS